MSTNQNITIAIVTRNRPYDLKSCLNSILKQSRLPQKIIVIDNGSTHKVKKLCQEMEPQFHIDYFYVRKPNIPLCRNLALKKCSTTYLAFVDDDCILNKNWLKNGYKIISQNNTDFVAGLSKLSPKSSYTNHLQYQQFLQWQKTNIKKLSYNPKAIDTKNIIFNLNSISGCYFDTKFKIFEDIDFGLQLSEKNLHGIYCSKMLLIHNEKLHFFKAITKNYLRGQYKAKITKKWGNFDNFSPSIPITKNPLDFIFKTAFNLGYLKNPPQPITIINNQDLGANGERLQVFYNFLKGHHFNVETINSEFEFKKVISSKKYLLIYGYPLFKYKTLKFIHDRFKINQDSSLLFQTLILRKTIINRLLLKNKTSLAIIQYPEDMMVVVNKSRPYLTLYDSPTIYFKELELSKNFPTETIKSLKKIESKVYRLSNYVSFHWYTFLDLAKKYGLKINHPLLLNWGCQTLPENIPTNFTKIKIIHLGKLNSYWVNPNLLQNISLKTTPNLNMYSYEAPDKTLYPHLHGFKGYLPTQEHLKHYHFGLITITKDYLRSHGFSAKYLLYLSYGLPVLCPEWRQDNLLKPATIYYNEKTFGKQLKKYSERKYWLKKHQAALKISQDLNWDKTLIPLLNIINTLQK